MNVLGTHKEELDMRMIWLLFSIEEVAERDAGNNVMMGCLVEAYSRYKHTVTSYGLCISTSPLAENKLTFCVQAMKKRGKK